MTQLSRGGVILAILGMAAATAADLAAGRAPAGIGQIADRANRTRSQNNLRQLAIAMYGYHDANRQFPPAVLTSADGKPLLSWRVALLPYLEQAVVCKEFKLDEPWDSENNKKLLAKMPKLFAPPGVETKEPGLTFYQVFTGPGAVFESKTGAKLFDIKDGTSNTLMIVEAGDGVPWTKPVDLGYDANQPLPKLGGIFNGDFNAAFCDGSVRSFKKGFDEKLLRALITRNGGEAVTIP